MDDQAGTSSTRGFWSQSAVLTVAHGGAAVLAAVYASVGTRLLGPEGYAPVVALMTLAGLLALVLGPLETGITRLAATFHAQGTSGGVAAVCSGVLRRLLGPLAVGLLACLLAGPLVRRALRLDGYRELGVLAAYAVFSTLAIVPRGAQRGDHRFFAYGVNLVVEAAARLGVGAAAMWLGAGAAGAIGGYAAGMVAALTLGLWQLRDLKGGPPTAIERGGLYAFSLPLFIVYFYFSFVVGADMLLAKRVLPPGDAGVYGACTTLTRLLYLAATPIYQVLFSRVATARARGVSSRRLAVSVTAAVAGGLALSNLVPWLFGATVLRLAFGADFAGGEPILRIQWATTSLLVVQAVAMFAWLGQGRTAGAWTLLLPCLLQVGLLWRFHDSATAIAGDSLVAAAAGLLAVGLLALRRH